MINEVGTANGTRGNILGRINTAGPSLALTIGGKCYLGFSPVECASPAVEIRGSAVINN